MALDEHIRILSGVRLFESFTDEQLRLLAFGAEAVRLPTGRKLYREDDAADCAYVVMRGEIGLFRDHDGQYVRIGTAGPGAVLGELALIADTTRLTSAAAETSSEVLRISKTMFRRVLEEYPDTAESLRAQIIDDLQALVSQIEKIGERLE
jgi:CRP-like cAMP-binding protein